METFGSRLQHLRQLKRLTQKQVAKHVKMSKSAIGMYERDEREPSFALVQQFADFYKVSADYLLGRSDSPSPSAPISQHHEDPNDIDPELAEALKDATPEQRQYVMDYLAGKVDSPVEFTDEEQQFLDDTERDLTPDDLMERYTLKISGRPATKEEIEEAIAYIRVRREMNKTE